MLKFERPIEALFPITKQGHYLASASIAGMHSDVIKAHQDWINFVAHEGGINDFRFFEVLESSRNAAASFYGCKKEENDCS